MRSWRTEKIKIKHSKSIRDIIHTYKGMFAEANIVVGNYESIELSHHYGIKKINDTQDVKGIVGRATLPTVLENAGAEKADMVIAVTRNDEINMVICQIAFSIFKIPKKIARIRSQDYLNPKFTRVYNKENLPIDVIISP